MGKKRRQVWWLPPRSSSHNSHRSQGWMEAHTHGHKHRQTDRQTDRRAHRGRPEDGVSQCSGAGNRLPPVHPGGLPAQPRNPRPGRTTSRGECGGPAG